MSLLDRFGRVVKAEWQHRFGGARQDHEAPDAPQDELRAPHAAGGRPAPAPPPRRPAVADVDAALRVLELGGTPTLDEVRARYWELARRYHPKTASANADEAHAARVVVETLTDALELLEEHLLPLPG